MAQIIEKVGSEVLVNTVTVGSQYESTVAGVANGGFVVSWFDESGAGGDADSGGIKAQLFDAAGQKVGSEVLVNTTTASFQFQPTAVGLSDGGFVVSWTDFSGEPGGIKAQLFDATGAKVGGEVLVNIVANGYEPTIASLADGGFVVSWRATIGTADADGTSVMAQIFDATGAKVGGEVLVNATTAGSQFQPTIAGLPGGGFVASWRDDSGTGGDASGAGIKAQVFDAAGQKVGGEVLVNTETLGDQCEPVVAGLSNGGFVVGWRDDSGLSGGIGFLGDVRVQLFDTAGQKVGGEVLVNTETNLFQHQPTIVGLPDGGFVVSWSDVSGVGADASSYGVKAQLFDAAGAKVGGEVLINTITAHDQWEPTIAARPDGFVVAWSDHSGVGGDAERYGIKAQLFRLAEANAAPVANDGSQVGPEDTAIAGQVGATDADGDALTYTLGQGAQDAGGHAVAGLIFNADGSYSFQGPQDFTGPVTFTYTASDGTAASGEATVTLTVAPVADAPVARADVLGGPGQALIHNGAPARLDVTALVANDGDPDGGPVRFAGIAAGPARGALEVVAEGGRTFLVYEYGGPQLAAGATADDDFTYRIVDASGATATARASLTVTGLASKSVDGTSRSETLKGGDLVHDTIHAGGGDDTIFGRAGRDRLFGEEGDDRLQGGDGVDRLSGGRGDDVLFGKAGRDRLSGGDGTDRLSGGEGRDTLSGGAGRDKVSGGSDDDWLYGAQGADSLRGGQGADRLSGGSGGDTLNGGAGRDRMFAGDDGGHDVFVYNSVADSRMSDRDVLYAFDGGEDRIDLRGIDVFDYAGRRSAAHSVWWTATDHGVVVSGDVTGDRTADFQIVVADVSSLGGGDFLL